MSLSDEVLRTLGKGVVFVVSLWIFWNVVLRLVSYRFGLGIQRLGLFSITGFNYVRRLPSAAEERWRGIRHAWGKKPAALMLSRLSFEAVWLDFHRPTPERPSRVSLRITKPTIVFQGREATPLARGVVKNTTPHKAIDVKRTLTSMSNLARNNFMKVFFRFFDVQVDDLQVIFQDPAGQKVLQLNEKHIGVMLHSSVRSERLEASTKSVKGPNVRAIITLDPIEVVAPMSPSEDPRILTVESIGPITLASRISVLGRVEQPSLDLSITGLSLAVNDLMQAFSTILGKGLPRSRSATDEPQSREADSRSPASPTDDPIVEDIYVAKAQMEKASRQMAMIFLVDRFRDEIDHLRRQLESIIDLKPTVRVSFFNTSVTFDPSLNSGCALDASCPAVMFNVDEMTFQSQAADKEDGRTSLGFSVVIGEFHVDLCRIPHFEYSAYQIFLVPRTFLDVEVTVHKKGHKRQKEGSGVDVRVNLDVHTPRLSVTDQLVVMFGEIRSHKTQSTERGHETPQGSTTWQARFHMAKILFGLLSSRLSVQIISPTVMAHVVGYDGCDTTQDADIFAVSAETLALQAKVASQTPQGALGNKASFHGADDPWTVEVLAEVQNLEVIGARGPLDIIRDELPERRDLLFSLENVAINSHVRPTADKGSDVSNMGHINVECHFGSAFADFSLLPRTDHIDYFTFMAKVGAAVVRLREFTKKPQAPVAAKFISFPFVSTLQVACSPISILLVGEDLRKAILLETKSVLLQLTGRPKELLSAEGGSRQLSARLEAQDIGVHTTGTFYSTEEPYFAKQEAMSNGLDTESSLRIRRIEMLHVREFGATDRNELTLRLDEVVVCFSLRMFYVTLMASIYCWKLVKLLDIEKTEKNKGKEIGTKSPVVHVEVQSLLVDITLPGHVHLRVGIQPIFIDTGEGLLVRAQTQLATVDVLTDEEQLIYERLTQVTELTVECRKPPGTSATKVEAEVMSAEVRVPYGFKMAKVIENAISMQKAIKRLCAAELGLRLKTPSTTGHSIPIYDTIPIIRVQISTLCIRFADDPFESALSRNYLLGFEEQEGRIARDKAFQTKAAALRSVDERRRGSVHDEHKQSTAVENAWGLLQEFNARAWIDRLRKAHKETEGPPPLMHTTITNIQVAIDPPVLLANSIEQTLHIIDPATPANALYDEQIPRNVTISMHSLKMQIRDYSAPLVCLPADGSVKLETKGLVIFAEQVSAAEANRTVVIPVGLPTGEEVVVARTVNPNKMYSSLTTTITTSSTIHAAWGASLEPGISDMISVFDTFTKPNVDPSQPLGWWDKLRLIMHGTHTLIITGGGDISFRVLGSTSPYFDGHKHFGTEGMQVSMRDGVRIEVNGSQIPGEDVTIECGELGFALPFNARAGHHHRAKEEDTVARMRGGVRLVFGFGFVTERNRRDPASGLVKSHADICLRAPEYIDSDQLRKWDSFRGFRSSSINITVRLESPKPFYAGLSEPSNSVHLTLNTMSRFFTFLQVYQSVLTSLPVRKGKLFQEDGPGPSKQKLGRTIGSIRIQTSLHPLLLGFVAEAQDKSLGVGLRCRAAQVVMDMTLLQRVIQQRRPKEELLKRKPTSKWILRDSELELTDVEARALAFGDFSEARPATLEKPLSVDELDQPGASDDKDWIFPRDALRKKRPTLNLVPFAWTPKIIYTKSNDTKVSGAQDSTRSKKDIFEVQKHLFKSRLREIEAAIRHYLEMQRGLEYRMAVFFDDSLRQQSQIIVEKMAILHEKKVVIERYIRSCQQKLECDNVGDKAAGRAERKLPAAAVFQHHFVVHNLNLIWKKDVRNILFQMVSLQQKAMAIKFCLSHTATKLMAQLVTSFAERRNRTDAPETAHDVLADTAKTAPAPKSSMVFAELDANAAHRLLNKLVDEMDTAFFVSNETEVEQDDDAAESNNRGAALAFNNRKVYFPSRDIESPDYISDSQTYESNFMMQLVYPQVNLEAESKDNPSHLESVVLAAESMQLRSIRILDAQASTSSTADENSDRNEEIVKSRMVVNIYDAQLFVARKTDIEVAPEFDLDNIAMHQPWDKSDTPTAAAWPIWVPIECIADHSSHPGFLERVVERVSASLHRDVPNPLYLKGDVASTQPETKHTLQINIPTFFITATAMQYMVIYDVIENLLVYRDPGRGEQVEKMTKMLLILEQMEDLRKVQETVLLLQQKIRQTEAMLHTDMDNSGLTVGASSHRNAEILRHLLQCQDELIIVVDAIKATQSLEQKKKSAAISSEILIKMGKMVWCMLTDEQTPLCEWTLDKAQFGGVHHEDQTDVNTLHIDKLHLENHMSAMNSFKEVIAPYSPDMTDVDFTRHKMIRVYWRQMAPVAGIKVVDHFEVNIYPLLIQVTYDMAKEIVFYLFPEKKAKAAAKTHAQQLHNTSDDKQNRRFPRSESADQIANRSSRSSVSDLSLRRVSSTSADNVAVVDDKLRPSSPSEPDMSPQTERKRRFKSGTFSYSHGRTLSSKSETKEEASSSPKLRRKETRVNELKQMQARASENRSFIYIKMPGANHCLSYRGSKEKNIEDLYMFAFKMPTLEFRNKTWTWLDFLDAVKKEALRAVLANTGALVREKLFVKRKPSTASDEHGNATLQAPPARHNKFPGRGIFGSRKDGSDKEKDTTKEKQKEKEKEKEVGKEKSQSGLPSKDKPTKEIKKTRMPPSTELLFEVNEED